MSVPDPEDVPPSVPPVRKVDEPGAAAGTDTLDVHALAALAAWIRSTHGEPLFRAVCASADLVPETLSNGGGRVAVARVGVWLASLRDRLGGDGALVAAGLASETPPATPPTWLSWIATPHVLYAARAGRRWITAGTGRITVRRGELGTTHVIYTAIEPQGRALCLWRHARLAQRPRTWGLPPAVVQERRCLAAGDDACEYRVRWHARPRWSGAIVATAAAVGVLVWVDAQPILAWGLAAGAAGLAHALEVERVRRANRATRAAFALAFRRATASSPVPEGAAPAEPEIVRTPEPAMDVSVASMGREGDFWRVTFASKTVLIRHSRGLALLVHLLRNPGQEIHVSALDALIPSDVAMPVAASAPADATVADLGDAGEVLDAQARASYRRRLVELREELAEAENNNDLGRVESLRAELEALTDQLKQATGLGGRSRRAASNVDRVRVAVTRRIRAAIVQIEKHHDALGAHLAATVHTGYFCSYGPGGVSWEE